MRILSNFPLNKPFPMETKTAEIQSIRSKYEYLVTNELKKPRPNYTTSSEIIKSITVILKKGPVVTDISPLREFFKTAIRNPFDRFSHFPLPLPVFQILPRLIRLNDKPTGTWTRALETTALLAVYANCAVTELITIIEFINATWEFLQEVGIFNTKLETISRVWVPKQQGIFSLYHPLKQLSSILSCHHHAAKEKLIFRYKPTISTINLSDCRIFPSFLGVNLLRLFSLVTQDRVCILPTSTLPIIYQALARQTKLIKNPQTKIQYRRKYLISAAISADPTRLLHEQKAEIQIQIETLLREIATPNQIDQQSPVKLVSKIQVTGGRKNQ